MKIALITDGIQPYVIGGMQKHSYCLAKYFAHHGIYVDLYHTPLFGKRTPEMESLSCFSDNEKKYIRPFLIDFPKESKLPSPSGKGRGWGFPGHYLRRSYVYSEKIYEILKRNLNNVDFIYAKGFTPWKIIEEKMTGEKIPPVGVKFHGYEMFQKATSLSEKIHRKLFFQSPVKFISRNADFVFSYGGKTTGLIEKLNVERKKIIEIPSGVEEDWLVPSATKPNKVRKFIFIGRFERRKGIQELSQAILNLDKRFLKNGEGRDGAYFEFHFVGPIPGDKEIISETIHYHGSISDPEKIKHILSGADVLVCPSYSEGMPNVIIEAMSRGLAIIATDVGAVNCLVNSENGFLLDDCSVKTIENAIFSAIKLPEEKLFQMKKNSLEKIRENFLWENISEKLIKEIEEKILKRNN